MPRTSSSSAPGLQLVEFSPRTFRAAGKKAELVPFMLVSRTGRISFNRKAVELMTKSYRMFQHTALAAKILDSLSFAGERLRIRIAGPTPPRRIIYVIDGGGRQECRNR